MSFCRSCGAPLYIASRRSRGTDKRGYRCRDALQSTGLCHARWIPAEVADRGVLWHLNKFVGDVPEWIARHAEDRRAEHNALLDRVSREKRRLPGLDREYEHASRKWRELVAAEDPRADLVLEQLHRIRVDSEEQKARIADLDACEEEWRPQPDLDTALALYGELAQLCAAR